MKEAPVILLDNQALLDRFGISGDSLAHRNGVFIFNVKGSYLVPEIQQYEGYLIIKCTYGDASITIYNKEHRLLYDSAIIIFPRTNFAFTKVSTSFKCTLVYISQGAVLTNQISSVESPLPFLSIPSSRNCDMLLALLSYHSVSNETIVLVINAIIASTLEIEKMAESEDQSLFASLLSLLDQEYPSRSLSSHQIAEHLKVSEEYLRESIRRAYDLDLHELIDKSITTKAIQLIRDGFRIYEVADILGFANQTTFGKFFKRQTGLTPKTYKKKKTSTCFPS